MNQSNDQIIVTEFDSDVSIAFAQQLFSESEDASYLNDRRIYSPLRKREYQHKEQEFAFETAFHKTISEKRKILLEGIAGVGKSTLLRYYFNYYRRNLTSEVDPCVLWVNLQNKTEEFALSDQFYSELKNWIEIRAGKGFDQIEKFWRNRIDERDGEGLRLARARGGNTEKDFIAEKIKEYSADNRLVVEEYLIEQRSLGSSIYLIVDNIDTMHVHSQTDALRFVVDQTDSENTISKYLDAVVISIRPETAKHYNVGQQLEQQWTVVKVPSLNVPEALKKRVEHVSRCLDKSKRQLALHINVDLPTVECAGEYWKLDSELDVNRKIRHFVMLNLSSHKTVVTSINMVSNCMLHGFDDDEDSIPGEVEGIRKTECWKIYQCLCGRSMRRSLQVSKAVMSSPGLIVDAISSRGSLRPYTFLDAIVSYSITYNHELVGETSCVADLYSISEHVDTPESVMFLPTLLRLLEIKLQGEEERAREFDLDFDKIDYDSQELMDDLKSLGFNRSNIGNGLDCAADRRFLVRLYDDSYNVVSYSIKKNLTKAHNMMLKEPAYTDNVAQLNRSNDLKRTIRFTVGYEPRHLSDRVINSVEFIEWLIKNEAAWVKRLDPSPKQRLTEGGYPSVAYLVAAHYHARLSAIKDAPTRTVSQKVVLKNSVDVIKNAVSKYLPGAESFPKEIRITDSSLWKVHKWA